jgi:hypothetical protein
MIFYDNYKTPLGFGAYRFVLQQTVSLDGGDTHHYYRDQRFEVFSPRYVIEGSEIQAHFPPPGGVADYQNILPHIVLRTRHLPWERQLWQGPEQEPWLALLVLSASDSSNGKSEGKMGTVADLKPQQAGAWSRTENGATIMLPQFKRTEDEQTPVRLLDLDLRVFLEICPRRADLPSLAHVRQVDTANKIPLEMAATGAFSVLVANRFPAVGANTVHLISLEGWQSLLDSPPTPQPGARIRLITLDSWNFVSDEAGHDTFGGLMQRLRLNAALFGVQLRSRSGNAYVQQALACGYVPLDYLPMESAPAFAWYRGPLAPIRRAPPLNRLPFHRADAALIFDDQTSLMDLSYASAWQLGRLLALSSPAFSKGLRLFVESCHNASEVARQIEEFLELHRNAFPDLTPGNTPAPGPEKIAIADELVQWIARLVLLYPAPFHYLIPNAALLPPESLRFFHLDDNWVDALVDGALSIAVRNSADRDTASRADLQSALSKIVYQYRLRLQGKMPEWNPKERYMDTPKSGLLLRSSIVSGWPGIEVTVETDGTDDALPKILRMDQIVDGVLFCLVRGNIQKVTFREPLEGLTFGVSSEGKLQGRRSGDIIHLKKDFMRPASGEGVVDIGAVRGKLERQEKVRVGAAEFAMQMLRMPEEQIIEWS